MSTEQTEEPEETEEESTNDTSRSREPAVRVLGKELSESHHTFKESDDKYAPNYLLLPSGTKANRVLVGGVLSPSSIKRKGTEENIVWSLRINDGTTESFRITASEEYNPEASSQISDFFNSDDDSPRNVLCVGKVDTFTPDDDEDDEGDDEETEVITVVRPENITEVSRGTVDTWMKEAVEHTVERMEQEEGEYVEMAEKHHENRIEKLRDDVVATIEELE